MSTSKMTIFTGLVALSTFAAGSVAESWSNTQSIKTLEPHNVGTATANGALLVSMNYCSIVINTQCQLSVMTSAPASPPPQSAASVLPVETTLDPIKSVPIPTRFSAPTSAVAPSTEATMPTETGSSTYETGEITEPVATATETSPTGAPAMTTTALTAAAAGIKAFPGAAWGAAILAVAVLL
ncbi:hypothetical protein VFPPC_16030 [Pochonia chlamydosporia 170]|uniref:Uncharacterized protein n=1 Tax=Pochonia chlamydosporia 170 TaxID=1380566 RepID=A0A179FMG2_METCM|nr:hypothetical protein VFPPC_16030 [Pochonia chlamydosporia 170]OAQ66440.1 hypothetical protein VFPPC_16030 [Pochonia chlamydosporia 170]